MKAQASLQERLRVAEQKEFANPLVYGLLALLALALAGLTWMWLRVRKSARAGYAWLGGGKTMPTYVEPLPDTGISEPAFVDTHNMVQEQPRPERVSEPGMHGAVQAIEKIKEKSTASIEDIQETQDAPYAPETFSSSMVFTKAVPKVDVHVDNNPLWPAEAASATHSDGSAPLVIIPTEAFMLPITQPDAQPEMHTESELQTAPSQAVVHVDLPLPAPIALFETLNIDLDFSKISPPPRKAPKPVDNHIEFYTDAEHAKAGQSEQHADQKEAALAAERKPKSPPKLPKSVHKPHKSTPSVSDQKTNLIDFESFANPPAPPRPSRFTS